MFFKKVFAGFAFFELINVEKKGEVVTEERYITFKIGKKPTLKAVTSQQYEKWRSQVIVAKPITAIWKKN